MKSLIKHIMLAVMTLGAAGTETIAQAADTTAAASGTGNTMQAATVEGMEKCYGVVKAGLNDCATAVHDCSGQAKTDRGGKEWVFVPTGLCSRITGGKTTPSSEA